MFSRPPRPASSQVELHPPLLIHCISASRHAAARPASPALLRRARRRLWPAQQRQQGTVVLSVRDQDFSNPDSSRHQRRRSARLAVDGDDDDFRRLALSTTGRHRARVGELSELWRHGDCRPLDSVGGALLHRREEWQDVRYFIYFIFPEKRKTRGSMAVLSCFRRRRRVARFDICPTADFAGNRRRTT